jgi:hypothetical protein
MVVLINYAREVQNTDEEVDSWLYTDTKTSRYLNEDT